MNESINRVFLEQHICRKKGIDKLRSLKRDLKEINGGDSIIHL